MPAITKGAASAAAGKRPKLTATKVNEATREVLEFDGRPAVEAYAEVVGCSIEEVPDY